MVKSGAVTVIDDSYNVNPVGASVALESLRLFEGARKIVYTSGMVELGEKEAEQETLTHLQNLVVQVLEDRHQ